MKFFDQICLIWREMGWFGKFWLLIVAGVTLAYFTILGALLLG